MDWFSMFIDLAAFQLIKQTIKKVGWIEIPAEGTSMFPIIKKGDHCRFVFCEPRELKRADIALFYTRKGQLVAHRFYYKQLSDEGIAFCFKGDTNLGFDGLVQEEQIIGKLTVIRRGRREMNLTNTSTYLWGKLIMSFPFLSGVLQRYLRRKSQYQSGVSS
jgi:signal peptidase I